MRRILAGLVAGIVLSGAVLAQGGSFNQQIQAALAALGYVSSNANFVQYSKSTLLPQFAYINFGGVTQGANGFGFRENPASPGTLQYRNNSGGWSSFVTGGFAGGAVTYIVQTPDTTVPNAQALSALASGIVLNTTTTGVLSTSLLVPATNFPALTGAITTPGGSLATTITNAAVTLAKIQNATANSRILCAGSSGSGASYTECTAGSGIAITGTVISSTAASVAGSNTQIQYNNSGAFGASANLAWNNGSSILTVTGTTTTSSFLAGNNSPSLTSPQTTPFAIDHLYTGTLGSTQYAGQNTLVTWTPTGSAMTGLSEVGFFDGTITGSQNTTGDIYGLHAQMVSASSATVSKEEGLRAEIFDSGNSGTTTNAFGVGSALSATNHTITEADNFHAYTTSKGSGGTITKGIEFRGDDPLGSSCTTCISEQLDFGARGALYISPTPATLGLAAAGNGFSYFALNAISTSNADFASGLNALMTVNPVITPSSNFSLGTIEVLAGQLTVHAAHNYSTDIIGVDGDVFVADGTGNFTSTGSGLSGVQGEVDFFGSGTVAEANAIETFYGSGGAGVITNGQSIWITAPYNTSSVVTNYVGLQIDNQTWPGSTTNYAILYNAPASKQFGVLANGNVMMGGATMTWPAANAAGTLTNNGSGTLSWSSTGLFPLRAPAGTSTAPSYSWTTATGVGLYEASTNQTGIVGGVILGKTASAARGSILYVSGSGIAPSASALEQIDLEPGLDTLQTLVVGQNGYGLYLNPTFSTSASGTNALVVNAYFDAGAWTNGGSTITEATTMYVAGAPSIGASKYAIHVAAGQVRLDGGAILKPTVFASVPVSPAVGTLWAISDSTTQTWGATVSGGGASFALINWDGANWVVFGK